MRTVDTAQFQRRTDTFDFDMIIGGAGQSLSPGNEQREFWGSAAAKENGSRNLSGIADPAIDQLIELVISAPDRQSLITRTRALDRVLLWHWYVDPALAFAGFPRRLLGRVRPTQDQSQIRSAVWRHLVDRSGQAGGACRASGDRGDQKAQLPMSGSTAAP